MSNLDDIRKLVHLARGGWCSPEQKDAEAQRVYGAVRAEVLADLVEKAEGWDGHVTVQELRRMATTPGPAL